MCLNGMEMRILRLLYPYVDCVYVHSRWSEYKKECCVNDGTECLTMREPLYYREQNIQHNHTTLQTIRGSVSDKCFSPFKDTLRGAVAPEKTQETLVQGAWHYFKNCFAGFRASTFADLERAGNAGEVLRKVCRGKFCVLAVVGIGLLCEVRAFVTLMPWWETWNTAISLGFFLFLFFSRLSEWM